MADPLLTPAEFAQSIKAKYPAYASIPDAELASRMLEKYPEYKDRVRTADFQTTNEPPSPSLLRQAGEAVENLGIGAVKGVGQSVIGAGRLVQMIPGVTRAVDALYGSPGISEEAMRQAEELVRPQGVAQHVGKGAEQIAELIVPGSKLAQAGEAAATRFAPTLAPLVGETVAKYAPRAAVEAAGQAGMAKIQGGDPRLAAAFGAATPALGAVVEALPQTLKEQASKQVVQALGPTKERFKAIAEKLAPNILQRGLRGSREALQDQAATTLSQVGDQLDTLLTQRGQQVISPQPVIQALETSKEAFRTTTAAGKIVEFEPRAIKQLNGLQQVLTDLGPTPTVEQLVAVRRAWAKREATSAIRELLAQQVPDLAAVNKEYAFWKGLNDVLTQTLKRTQPQGPSLTRQVLETGSAAMGGAIGSTAGPVGAAGGVALGKVMAMAQSTMRSPAWKLASAQAKDRLADAIVSNNAGKIAMALARISAVEGSKLTTATP